MYYLKSSGESLVFYPFVQLLKDSDLLYGDSLGRMRSDGEFHKVLLFYDLYGNEDEEIARKLQHKMKKYLDFANIKDEEVDYDHEKVLRKELINTMEEVISYLKKHFHIVRTDLQKLLD